MVGKMLAVECITPDVKKPAFDPKSGGFFCRVIRWINQSPGTLQRDERAPIPLYSTKLRPYQLMLFSSRNGSCLGLYIRKIPRLKSQSGRNPEKMSYTYLI